jgi:hypothetical protein
MVKKIKQYIIVEKRVFLDAFFLSLFVGWPDQEIIDFSFLAKFQTWLSQKVTRIMWPRELHINCVL